MSGETPRMDCQLPATLRLSARQGLLPPLSRGLGHHRLFVARSSSFRSPVPRHCTPPEPPVKQRGYARACPFGRFGVTHCASSVTTTANTNNDKSIENPWIPKQFIISRSIFSPDSWVVTRSKLLLPEPRNELPADSASTVHWPRHITLSESHSRLYRTEIV